MPITGPPVDPQQTHLAFVISDNAPNNDGSVTHVNVSGDTNMHVSTVGVGPVHATLLPDGSRLFVANRDSDTLTSYSPLVTSIAPTSMNLPSGSRPVFVHTREQTKIYTANSGRNSVGIVAAQANALSTEITVGANPVALAETRDGKKLYSVNQGDGTISVIDTANAVIVGSPIPLDAGSSPVWALISSDGLSLYVLDQGLSNITVIDTLTDTVVGSVSVGTSPNYMFLDTRLNRLYVTNQGDNTLSFLDASVTPPNLPQLQATIAIPPGPTAVTVLADGSRAYVSRVQVNGGKVTAGVTAVDANSHKILRTLNFASTAPVCDATVRFRSFVTSSPDSAKVYVSACDAGVTHILSSVNNSEIASIASPVSAFSPPKTGAQPPPQRPVFLLAGP